MEGNTKGFTAEAARTVLNELDAMRQRIIALHPHIELDTGSRSGGLNPHLPGIVMDSASPESKDDPSGRPHGSTPRQNLHPSRRLDPMPMAVRTMSPTPSAATVHSEDVSNMSAHDLRELVRKELHAEVRSRKASEASKRPSTQEVRETLTAPDAGSAEEEEEPWQRASSPQEGGPLEESVRRVAAHKPEQHNFMTMLHLAPAKSAPMAHPRRESRESHDEEEDNPPQAVLTEEQMRVHQLNEDQREAEERLWLQQAENAYGAFIHVALKDNIWKALAKCGPMLLASVLVQAIFSFRLFQHLPDFRDVCVKQVMCSIPSDLQLSAVGVFITLMLNNVPVMFRAATISIKCAHRRNNQEPSRTNVVDIKISVFKRLAIFILAVLSELLTWSAIFTTGILFILTSKSVELLIRSTVAIMFVQNVDEVVFEACCSPDIKEEVENFRYKVDLQHTEKRQVQLDQVTRIYLLFLHLPVIVLIVSALVFGFREIAPQCAGLSNDDLEFIIGYPECRNYTLAQG